MLPENKEFLMEPQCEGGNQDVHIDRVVVIVSTNLTQILPSNIFYSTKISKIVHWIQISLQYIQNNNTSIGSKE